MAPRSPPGLVRLSRSPQTTGTTPRVSVHTFYEDPATNDLLPVSGPSESGGTVVTVRGRGFRNTSLLSLSIWLLEVVPAIWVDRTEMKCRTSAFR